MGPKIKFYVVRASFGAEVYASLDFAKEEVKDYLHISDFGEGFAVTIECWVSTGKITEGWQWVSYNKRKIASSVAFNNATEDERLKLFAKDFAKSCGAGYMREEVYVFGASNGEFFGSLNGRPVDIDFLKNQHHGKHWPIALMSH